MLRSYCTNTFQYECAAFIIDTWIDAVAQGRSNVAPLKMPWDLIRALITEAYGGKIDSEDDFNQLAVLVDSVLTPAAFDTDHKLVGGVQGKEADDYTEGGGELIVPGGTGMGDFMEWVNRLPEREPPTYLGLPANAEKLLLVGHGKDTIANLARITDILEEGEQLMAETRTES